MLQSIINFMRTDDQRAKELSFQAMSIMDKNYIPKPPYEDESASITDDLRQALSLFREAYDIAQDPVIKNQIKKSLHNCSNELAHYLWNAVPMLLGIKTETLAKLGELGMDFNELLDTETKQTPIDQLRELTKLLCEVLELATDPEFRSDMSKQLVIVLGNLAEKEVNKGNFVEAITILDEALGTAREYDARKGLKNKKIVCLLSEIKEIRDDTIPIAIKNLSFISDLECEIEPQVQRELTKVANNWGRYLIPQIKIREQVIEILGKISEKLTLTEHKAKIENLALYCSAQSLKETMKQFEHSLALVKDPTLEQKIKDAILEFTNTSELDSVIAGALAKSSLNEPTDDLS